MRGGHFRRAAAGCRTAAPTDSRTSGAMTGATRRSASGHVIGERRSVVGHVTGLRGGAGPELLSSRCVSVDH